MVRGIPNKEKACIVCNELYKPSNNRQQACSNCTSRLYEGRENPQQKYARLNRSKRYADANARNLSLPIRYLYSIAKHRAKIKGLEFTIQLSDITTNNVCPALGVEFKKATPYAMSLDRIDSNKGYIPGNVQVISKKANTMKNDASAEELLRFADWVYANYKNN